jgi:hypothetical protein
MAHKPPARIEALTGALHSALMAMMFCTQPETWPVMTEWSATQGTDLREFPPEYMARDMITLLALLDSVDYVGSVASPETLRKAQQAMKEAGLM